MSDQTKEDFDNLENLLGHTPYIKSLPYNSDEFFQAFLVYVSQKYSLVPELSKILNPEDLLNLLFVFAGQILEIPEQKAMNTAFRDLDVYFSLKKTTSSTEINRLATKYSTSTQTIKSISNKVAETLGYPPIYK